MKSDYPGAGSGLSVMTVTSPIARNSRDRCGSLEGILVGMATDELNFERNGEMDGRGSLCIGAGLKSGVW
ncbi:MAG: hypothetical protein U9N43_02290 [Euryarchaeota archaeon]|nr:hypothetical protein [Euryarchaeota archaeon]